MKARLFIGGCLLLLVACGSPVDGTYSDAMGLTSYTFKDGDKVYVSAMGAETELKYSVEDDKIRIESPQGNLILTLNEDGSLQGPMGMTLTKKKAE